MKREKEFKEVSLPEPKVLDSVIWDAAIIVSGPTKKVEPVSGFYF